MNWFRSLLNAVIKLINALEWQPTKRHNGWLIAPFIDEEGRVL